MVTLQIAESLRFGELAVNSNSPIFSAVKLWRVSRNFMYLIGEKKPGKSD